MEITTLIAGDSASWTKELSSYSPQDGWVLSYVFLGESSEQRYSVEASSDQGDFNVTLSSEETAPWLPGKYKLIGSVKRNTERATVYSGFCTVSPNHDQYYDPRSYSEKMLSAIEAVLEERATRIEKSYAINGRQLELLSPEELIKMRSKFQLEVKRQSGRYTGKIVTRFS